ncbi:hypothetical protein ACVC7V_15695 [Hydrogenophaga sp. A37]|uniref:hypothetical protein n=1 Tax=Hydrogenophaga sp. A37 TaxID=1945864 RepID=UPI000987354E|nr:hypothetical protein [Hydrogenophaga sp. A37]OOG80710.1 hypothetical protein B0E41_20055 [Hydrogenophaga sp. A37]
MTTEDVPRIYRRLATAIGAEHWQGAVARQEEAIRANHFLGDYLRSEYAIAYQLDRLRRLVARFGTVPHDACNDPSTFPSLAFAAQVLRVLEMSPAKQAKAFVRRVRTALSSSTEMHGLRLELQAATHFARRGHRVAWHRVKNEGSFDLLIGDLGPSGLEIECKSISENKGRRIHRRASLDFWSELWKDLASVAQNLRSGLAVVLTVPYRIPDDAQEQGALGREVVTRILAGSGATLGGGAVVRIEPFDPARIEAAKDRSRDELRKAIDDATGTANREVAVYGTPAGGMLAFVMQSAVEDDVLDQVFATLDDSAARQFTRKRGALFWVQLQGIDADQLLSIHEQDGGSKEQPTALRIRASAFLHRAPDHIVGVVFSSRSGLSPVVDGKTDSAGATYFFLKEESPLWHASFRGPLRPIGVAN